MKSPLYTMTGDHGRTSLVGGTRVSKCDPRIEAYGTVDELNSWLGLLICSATVAELAGPTLYKIQNRLFDIGSMLATEADSSWQPAPLPDSAVDEIESEIDRLDATLPRHNRFILPGGSPDAARAHIARCVARRAERLIVSLASTVDIQANIIRYVNRLSDYLFVLARAINIKNGADEIFWEKNC